MKRRGRVNRRKIMSRALIKCGGKKEYIFYKKTQFQSKRVSLSVKKLEQILKENKVTISRRNLDTALAQ